MFPATPSFIFFFKLCWQEKKAPQETQSIQDFLPALRFLSGFGVFCDKTHEMTTSPQPFRLQFEVLGVLRLEADWWSGCSREPWCSMSIFAP